MTYLIHMAIFAFALTIGATVATFFENVAARYWFAPVPPEWLPREVRCVPPLPRPAADTASPFAPKPRLPSVEWDQALKRSAAARAATNSSKNLSRSASSSGTKPKRARSLKTRVNAM